MPTHPTDEALSKCTIEKKSDLMQTYGRRAVRARTPNDLQQKAAWGNFTFRTNTKVHALIAQGAVHCLFCHIRLRRFPGGTANHRRVFLSSQRRGVLKTRKIKIKNWIRKITPNRLTETVCATTTRLKGGEPSTQHSATSTSSSHPEQLSGIMLNLFSHKRHERAVGVYLNGANVRLQIHV